MRTKFYLLATVCLSFFLTALRAQSPGGVNTNLTLWVKSNSGTSTTVNGATVNTWTYANDGAKSFTQGTGGAQPVFSTNVLNFQPGLTFSGGQFMDGPNLANAPIAAGDDDYSAFVVWRSTSILNLQRVWSQRRLGPSALADGFSLATGGTGFVPGNYGNQIEASPYSHTLVRAYSPGSWNITQLNLLNQATNDLEIIDDRNLSFGGLSVNTDPGGTPNGALLRALSADINRLGARDNSADEAFLGNVAEIIVFDRSISGTDRNQIFSYLAMKYGVMLGTNLVNSAGTTVWNATTNSLFNNAVFGLSRDDNSGLTVNQSNSIVTGSGDGTGISGEGNIVLSSPSSLDNNDFLMIGNDAGSLSETTSDIPLVITGSQRLVREWKVQHTGNVGNVSFSFDFTGITTTGTIGTTSHFRIMVDSDGDGDFTTGTIRYYAPSSFTGDVANFNNVVLNNGEIFTILSSTVPSTLPVNWLSFTGKQNDAGVVLTWKVDNNQNGSHYNVESSSDGFNFSSIARVDNDINVKTYSYLDRGILGGVRYYRIRQTDIDGRYTISSIVKVSVAKKDFAAYLIANPVVQTNAEIIISSSRNAKVQAEIWSLNGKKVSAQQQVVVSGNNRIMLSTEHLQAGQYIIRIALNDKVQSIKMTKL